MRIAVILFVLLDSLVAQAQDCPSTPAIAAVECLSHKLESAEAVLANSFNQLLSVTPVNEPNELRKTKELLTDSQKIWLSYRNAYCEYKGFVEGGAPPYKGVRKTQCLVQLTEARSAELKSMREFYE